MYALVKYGTVLRYPYSPTDLLRDNPNTSFPRGPLPEELLREWGVVAVHDSAPPVHDPRTQAAVELDPVPVDGVWTRSWAAVPLTAEQKTAAQERLAAQYSTALTAHLDAVAQQRRYDNRVTCALRAGYPGPFRVEGQAFAQWMDECNAAGYALLAQVQSGQRGVPSVAEFLEALPKIRWPD